ncbi:MAG: DNA primase [Leptospiraceae bacterium]|nr:DNA primase [Leptospiraceae bacterium]
MVHNNVRERIKREVRIESFISRYVKLKQIGKRFLGLCPFHKEKTPSFTVSPSLGIFHCFGCGKSGDIFSFVQEYEKVDFKKALEILANYAGIPLEVSIPQEKEQKKKEELYTLNYEFMNYFKSNLHAEVGRFARNYLTERGLSSSDLESFSLGFALPGYNNLETLLENNSEKIQKALLLGLIKQREKGGYYDFFRNRIIFPILDANGKVAGFGGRIFQESEEAKYINSPQSPIYDKGKMFYGLYQALPSCRETRTAILVEGYLDVIGLHSKGIRNVVAPLGTSLTQNQVKILRNYVNNLIICFDGDPAGRKAAFRAVEICLQEGLETKVILLENGIDPFDLSQQKTKLEIESLLHSGIAGSLFAVQELVGSVSAHSSLEEKKKVVQNLFQFIQRFSREIDKDFFITEIGRILHINPTAILKDIKTETKVSFLPPQDDKQIRKPEATHLQIYERFLIGYLVLYPNLWESLYPSFYYDLVDENSRFAYEYLMMKYTQGKEIRIELLDELQEDVRNAIFSALLDINENTQLREPQQLENGFFDITLIYKKLKFQSEIESIQTDKRLTIDEKMKKIIPLKAKLCSVDLKLRAIK